MRDIDVRRALKVRLLQEHALDNQGTLLVDELGVCGESRVDLAVVNGALTGYEVKSARDNLDRLPNQIATYGRVLDFAYLVVAESHLRRARLLLPPWWGILVARDEDGHILIRHQRLARPNRSIDSSSLVQLLWREEALSVLERHGLDYGYRGRPRHELWGRLAERVELNELRCEVRQALRARRGWRVSPVQHESVVTSRPLDEIPRFLARRLR